MNEFQTSLSIGQRAVVDAYLSDCIPANDCNPETDYLYDTATMIMEMDSMADLDANALTDYLAEKGFSAHYTHEDGISGWVLRCKDGKHF